MAFLLPIAGAASEALGPILAGVTVDLMGRVENRLTEHRTATVQLIEGVVHGVGKIGKARSFSLTPNTIDGPIGVGITADLTTALAAFGNSMDNLDFTSPAIGGQYDSDVAYASTFADLYTGRDSKRQLHTFSQALSAINGSYPGGSSAFNICNGVILLIESISTIQFGEIKKANRKIMMQSARRLLRLASIGFEIAGLFETNADKLSAVSSVHGLVAKVIGDIDGVVAYNRSPMKKVFVGSTAHTEKVPRGISGASWHVIDGDKNYFGFSSMVTIVTNAGFDYIIYNHGYTDGKTITFTSESRRINRDDVNSTAGSFVGINSTLPFFQKGCIILDVCHDVTIFGFVFPDRNIAIKDPSRSSGTHSEIVEFFKTGHPMHEMSPTDWFAVACNGHGSVQTSIAIFWTVLSATTYTVSPDIRGRHELESIPHKHTESVASSKSSSFTSFISSAFTELKKLSFKDVREVGTGIFDFVKSIWSGAASASG